MWSLLLCVFCYISIITVLFSNYILSSSVLADHKYHQIYAAEPSTFSTSCAAESYRRQHAGLPYHTRSADTFKSTSGSNTQHLYAQPASSFKYYTRSQRVSSCFTI